MLKSFGLASKILWRDCRAGEWVVIFFALLLAITATTSINFLTDRLGRGLSQRSAQIFGGDVVISSSAPFPDSWHKKSENLHLRAAEVWTYPSMIRAKNKLQLVNVQAVSDSYPLTENYSGRPDPHTVWVESRLFSLLSIKINDLIILGKEQFRVAKVITPDKVMLNTGWIMAPRLLMRLSDVAATQTVIPGSRVDFHFLISGDKLKLDEFQKWVTPQQNSSKVLQNIRTQQLVVSDILKRTKSYLQLILLVCLLMSGVAIAMSVNQYLRRHYSYVAVWRALGSSQQQVTQLLVWQLIQIACIASMLAIPIGYILHLIIVNLLQDYLQFILPPAGIAPVLLGLVTSVLLLFGFAYPVISKLPHISPLYLWKNEIPADTLRTRIYYMIAAVITCGFIYLCLGFTPLALYFICSLLISISVLLVVSLLLLYLLRVYFTYTEGAIRNGVRQLITYPRNVSLQFVGFNLILISIIMLGMIRVDLVKIWKLPTSKKVPNYFAFNIAPDEVSNIKNFLSKNKIDIDGIYPMVRGRVIGLNGKPILTVVPKEAIDNTALHRELYMSWMWEFPPDNKIVNGSPWSRSDAGKPMVSVLNKFAMDLKLHIGDELTFQIGDQQLRTRIASFRDLNWTSFHPNFYMIFPPGVIDHFSATYITSFYLNSDQTELLNSLVQFFPNVSIVDVASLLKQVQEFIDIIIAAMQYLFILALCAGVLTFIAGLQASMDERRQTYYLLRVLGASRKYIRNSVLTEFITLISLICLTSLSFAFLLVYLIEKYIFNI